jgi:hypothetical protein
MKAEMKAVGIVALGTLIGGLVLAAITRWTNGTKGRLPS